MNDPWPCYLRGSVGHEKQSIKLKWPNHTHRLKKQATIASHAHMSFFFQGTQNPALILAYVHCYCGTGRQDRARLDPAPHRKRKQVFLSAKFVHVWLL